MNLSERSRLDKELFSGELFSGERSSYENIITFRLFSIDYIKEEE